ncbi:MAG: hypothetical protein WB679_05100 [Terracidiphilus sp.]
MSSSRMSPSSVIASTSTQQTGHQVTTVLPLRTTSRLSVSIVILVVFITTARSDPLIANAAPSISRILRESAAKSLQCALQYFSRNFKWGFIAANARVTGD